MTPNEFVTRQYMDLIQNKVKKIPLAIKPAINGSVRSAQRIYREISGINRSRKFFYSEAEENVHGRTMMQRTALFYFAVALASDTGAGFIETEIRSWFDIRAGVKTEPVVVDPNSLWDRAADCTALLSGIHRAWGDFDIPKTRDLLIRLRVIIDGMIKMVDMMPKFEREGEL